MMLHELLILEKYKTGFHFCNKATKQQTLCYECNIYVVNNTGL